MNFWKKNFLLFFITLFCAPFFLNAYSDCCGVVVPEKDCSVFPIEQPSGHGITGDWSCARDFLEDLGIVFHGSYTINAAANTGGRSQGIAEASSIESDCTFDLEQLLGIPHLSLFVSSSFRFGHSLAQRRIGNRFSVQQVFGGQTIRLVDLYFRYCVPDLFFCKIGRINTGEDFQTSEAFSQFMNNAFNGNPITPNFNFVFSNFPVSTWGAYLQAYVNKQTRVKAGIYNNNEKIFANSTHGVDFGWSPSLGVLLYTEAQLFWQHTDFLYGIYSLGAGYSTGKTNRILLQNTAGNYELYAQMEQTLQWEDAFQEKSITPFAAFLYFPEDRNEFPYFFLLGINGKGLFPDRQEDSLNLGFAQGFFSSKLEDNQTFEAVFEVNYKAQITSYCYLQPNIQYIIRPSGKSAIPNALVFGLQSECVF